MSLLHLFKLPEHLRGGMVIAVRKIAIADNPPTLGDKYIIYIYGYWVKSVPHGTAFINCTCMFEGYINLPSTHIYQRHS